MKHIIYINEARFEADEDTINKVIAALEAAGFTYDEATQGFVEPGFYETTE
jgi:hypothetical protein